MSFVDKFLNIMRLNPDDDDDFYNEDYDYDEEEEVSRKPVRAKKEVPAYQEDYKEKPAKARGRCKGNHRDTVKQSYRCLER